MGAVARAGLGDALTSTGDSYVPTEAGRIVAAMVGEADAFRAIDEDLGDAIAGFRQCADDGDWREVPAWKLRAIASGLERLRPIDSHPKCIALARAMRRYGLDREGAEER